VHVGGVQEGDAEVEGAVDGVDAGLLIGGAVELRHPHAAQAELGDLEGGRLAESASGESHAFTELLGARAKSSGAGGLVRSCLIRRFWRRGRPQPLNLLGGQRPFVAGVW